VAAASTPLREALRQRLPSEILDGTKRGFDTPLRPWLAGPLAATARRAVNELPETWFDRRALTTALEDHVRGARDHGRLLWSLIVLEHWRTRHAVEESLAD
jgi:asparagine synthase (glutamine-hydrolysing)